MKTIFITGASSGFGKETAKLFQSLDWNVVATMRSPEKEMELAQLENVLVLPLDVTNKRSIDEAVKKSIEKFGNIDILVNNAGYGLFGVFESATQEQIQKQYNVNVFGLMDVTQAVLPVMRKNKSGTIINISSFGGVIGLQFGSLYNSSKFAVEGFSEAMSHELAFLNIAVKIVEPGSVSTNFRTGMEFIKNEIADYNPEMASFVQRHDKRTEHLSKATAQDVANKIYEAATDEKKQLRYVAGEDSQFYIDLKMKNNEAELLKTLRD